MKKILLLPLIMSLICLLGLPFYAQAQHTSCPNAICETGETYINCPQDCDPPNTCGNDTCESYETTTSCPGDCADPCGNGMCVELSGEDCSTCPVDCGICPVDRPEPRPSPEEPKKEEPKKETPQEEETLDKTIKKQLLFRKDPSGRLDDLTSSPNWPEYPD